MSNSSASDRVGVEVIRSANAINRAVARYCEGDANDWIKMKGLYTLEVVRDGVIVETVQYPNLITLEGRRHILQVAMTGGTNLDWNNVATVYKSKPDFFVFLTSTVHAGASTQTYDVPEVTEFTGYSDGTLPQWNGALDGTQASMTNTASKATFNITAGATIEGAGMVSNGTKNNLGATFATNQDVLISFSPFTAPITVTNGDVVNVTIALSLT